MSDEQAPKTSNDSQGNRQGNLNVSIGGNVGPGAAIGQDAYVRADNIAGRDLTDNRQPLPPPKTPEDFNRMLAELRVLIQKAQAAGELKQEAATTAIENVQAASDMVVQQPPPKTSMLRRLGDVADLLDAASKAIQSAGGVATVLTEAIPMVTLLLDVVNLIF